MARETRGYMRDVLGLRKPRDSDDEGLVAMDTEAIVGTGEVRDRVGVWLY